MEECKFDRIFNKEWRDCGVWKGKEMDGYREVELGNGR